MSPDEKKTRLRKSGCDIKALAKAVAKSSRSMGVRVKNQEKTKMNSVRPTTIEQEYVRLFTGPKTPLQGFYSEDYDLRQPSVLKYVPSTTEPNAEV